MVRELPDITTDCKDLLPISILGNTVSMKIVIYLFDRKSSLQPDRMPRKDICALRE